jgi:hypothetical protein
VTGPDETRVRAQIHRAIGDLEVAPWLRSSVMVSLPDRPRPRPPIWLRAAGALAAVVAVAVVASSMLLHLAPTQRAAPAGMPAPGGATALRLQILAALDFRCTLPLSSPVAAAVSLPSGSVVLLHPAPAPAEPSTYTRGRWVPALAAWVAADGGSYASIVSGFHAPNQTPFSTLHLTDVASGVNRAVWHGDGHADVIGWDHGSVVLAQSPAAPGGKGYIDLVEIWTVDPARGSAHRVWPNGPVSAPSSEADRPLFSLQLSLGPLVGEGAVWTVAPSKPATLAPDGNVTKDLVERLDLATGALSVWYRAPAGQQVDLAALDAQGHPVVMLTPAVVAGGNRPSTSPVPAIAIVTGRDETTLIADGSNAELQPTSMVGDSHGLWIGTQSAIWLYRRNHLERVAIIPDALYSPRLAGSSAAPVRPTPTATVMQRPRVLLSGPCR